MRVSSAGRVLAAPAVHRRASVHMLGGALFPVLLVAVAEWLLIRSIYGDQRAVLVVLLIAGVTLMVFPFRWLPVLALGTALAVPVTYLTTDLLLTALAPANVAMAVYAVRVVRLHAIPSLVVLAFAAYSLTLALTVAPISTGYSAAMAANYLVVLGLALGSAQGARVDLTRVWVWSGVTLAVVAVAERVAGGSPFADFFATSAYPLTQVWATYRVFTTLGHPLVNGTFFAMTGGVAVLVALRSRRTRHLVCVAVIGVGVALTGSRGATIAFLAAGLVALLVHARVVPGDRRSGRVTALACGVAGLAAAALFLLQALSTRATTGEARDSGRARELVLAAVVDHLRDGNWFGVGPGLSGLFSGDSLYSLTGLPIESSPLQLLLSLGLPGTIVLLGALVVRGLRSFGDGDGVIAVLLSAYLVSGAFFNLVEGYPALVALLTVALSHGSSPQPISSPNGLAQHGVRESATGHRAEGVR